MARRITRSPWWSANPIPASPLSAFGASVVKGRSAHVNGPSRGWNSANACASVSMEISRRISCGCGSSPSLGAARLAPVGAHPSGLAQACAQECPTRFRQRPLTRSCPYIGCRPLAQFSWVGHQIRARVQGGKKGDGGPATGLSFFGGAVMIGSGPSSGSRVTRRTPKPCWTSGATGYKPSTGEQG